MWELTKSFRFEAAHALPGTTLGAASQEIHGHSFRAEVTIRGTPDPATGMVLVIVTRNIDLSVGSIMGMVGMYMGLLQVEYLTPALGLGHPSIWIITVLFGIAMGAIIEAAIVSSRRSRCISGLSAPSRCAWRMARRMIRRST